MLLTAQLKEMQKNHFLHWNGSVAADLLLLSLTGKESVSTPFCFELRSLTELDEKGIAALHGKQVSCQIGDSLNNLPQRYIHGVVTHILRERDADDQAVCILRLEPTFALLHMGRSMRVWQNITVPDLVSKLLGERGINQIDMQLHNTYQIREYCIQYRESDFDFICRLLEEEGIYYFFKHQENQHQMVLADHPASHPTAKAASLLWHHQGQTLTPGNIDSWSSSSVLIPGEVALSGYNVQQAAGIADNYTSKSENQSIDQVSFTDITPLVERSQLTSKAKNAMEAFEANATFYEASVNAHWLTCGEIFTLTDHPTDSDSYRIHALNIEATNNFDSSAGNCRCEIKSLRNSVKWRAACTRTPPDIAGVLIAKVVGPSSEEIHTDESGRIKIQFPWDTENKNDDTSSCWVRVSQPWTGSKFGGQFIPRIGSEVLISFIQGNPDYPLVTGSVYNGQNKLPFTLPDEKTESGFASRSTSKGGMEEGHRLSFNDKKGEEKLTITAQKDLLLTVKNDVISEVTHEVKSKVGANRDTEITKGNDNLVLKQGNLLVTLNKGDMEQKITGNVTTSLSNGNYTLTATGGSGKIKTDKTCVIESTQSIELKVGSNKIAISPSGITISGTMIKIEGSGTAELKGAMTTVQGSGMTQIKGGIINIG
ncbi:type VI secretion system Vgr family protein [Ewingella americana]|uniref:Type VI secretion system tip protein VgrG n=1 Tax=Ewingella americana TaxID=41202 RepID=A0A502GQX6_9GAMM|nr:type VI secretion system tip protein TssI/VgrG [Ewingella americana]TPG64284.1 type VI secretion system tip protein VgrG [Ewingella americana]